jgi:hypothetical protein
VITAFFAHLGIGRREQDSPVHLSGKLTIAQIERFLS